MSTIKISIRTISEKNGWRNLTSSEDKEISCFVKDGKNPLCEAILSKANNGDTVELPGKLVDKDGKTYLWDVQGAKGGFAGKSFAPKDKNWESALTAATAAGNMLALTKDATPAQFDVIFNHIYTRITEKINKTSEPSK